MSGVSSMVCWLGLNQGEPVMGILRGRGGVCRRFATKRLARRASCSLAARKPAGRGRSATCRRTFHSDNRPSFFGVHVDIALLIKAAIMGVVEGLTEFLPISSTGHLILAGSLLGFDDDKAKVFDIAIQTGAIFAVVLYYWQKISSTVLALPSQRQAQRFALNVLIGFLPAAVLGLLVYKTIKAHLFNPGVVAGAFIVGALIILWVEKVAKPGPRIQSVDDMTALDAVNVGLVQCLGMIPGTSRSGATIIGGMLLG